MTIYERNFKALDELGIVEKLKKHGFIKMNSRGLMDLSVNKLCEDQQKIIFSMAHYGEQNGDLMADPDMELMIMKDAKEVQALSYRNDYAGFFQEVYDNYENPSTVKPKLQKEANEFLSMWLGNIKAGGYFVCQVEDY